jgi:hypothetical protein
MDCCNVRSGWLYVVEMVLKVVAYGFHNYWRSDQNRFDFVITVTVVVVETLTFILPSSQSNNEEWYQLFLDLLIKIVGNFIATCGIVMSLCEFHLLEFNDGLC